MKGWPHIIEVAPADCTAAIAPLMLLSPAERAAVIPFLWQHVPPAKRRSAQRHAAAIDWYCFASPSNLVERFRTLTDRQRHDLLLVVLSLIVECSKRATFPDSEGPSRKRSLSVHVRQVSQIPSGTTSRRR